MDALVTCPYNSSHRILRHRLQTHLAKCSKNYPSANLHQCPYNATHIIPYMEYEHHIATCESTGNILNDQYSFEPDETLSTVPHEEFQKIANIPSSENWNTESTHRQSYNPLVHIQNKNIIRPLMCASKAKKKQFRKEERLRIESLDNVSELPSTSTLMDNRQDPEGPLRPPKQSAQALLNIASLSEKDEHTSTNNSLRENEIGTNSTKLNNKNQDSESIKKGNSTSKTRAVSKKELNILSSDLKTKLSVNVDSKDNIKLTQNNELDNASLKHSSDAETTKVDFDTTTVSDLKNKNLTKMESNERLSFENTNPYSVTNLWKNVDRNGVMPMCSTGRGHILACQSYKKLQKNVGLQTANNLDGLNKEILKKETNDVTITSKTTKDNVL